MKFLNFLFFYKITIIGLALGSIAGYLYYLNVGCDSGNCMITSKPINSSIYGAIMGGLLFNIFEPKTQNKK